MTTYFDATVQGDKDLLPFGVRSNTELAKVAARVEKEVIAEYTRRVHYTAYTARAGQIETGGLAVLVNAAMNIYVFLRGYAVDASAADAGLADALKQEIADVIAWRFARMDVNVMTTSESGNDASKSLRQDVGRLFPPGFGRWLRDFDLREPVWGC